MVKESQKGISVIEALVCMVIIGIGFVAMMQLSAYSIGAMDRSIEKNKMNLYILFQKFKTFLNYIYKKIYIFIFW